jgi:hypothetical protein
MASININTITIPGRASNFFVVVFMLRCAAFPAMAADGQTQDDFLT